MVQPFKGGAWIRHVDLPDNRGTLGCVVRARGQPGLRYILSAGHVLGINGNAMPGDAILALDQSTNSWIQVASYTRSARLRAGSAYNRCDAAIAQITDNSLVSSEIESIGVPGNAYSGIWDGMGVKLRGAPSAQVVNAHVQTSGNRICLNCVDPLNGMSFTLNFEDQIVYGDRIGTIWAPAAAPGFSGALVLNAANRAVGLHIAKTPDDYAVAGSVCTPITSVLEELEVELDNDAATPSDTDTLPPPAPMPAPAPPTGVAPDSGAFAQDDPDVLGQRSIEALDISVRPLLEEHGLYGPLRWQLVRDGLVVDRRLPRSVGRLVTVPKVWEAFGPLIRAAAARHHVPVELILATICVESRGHADAVHLEPGWISDADTPDKVSAGLMQTLISTARGALDDPGIDRSFLLNASNSIEAGTAYIRRGRFTTMLDPPLVACHYNAGNLYVNDSPENRWKLRQYPIGTSRHADRFVEWFNDCFAFFSERPAEAPVAEPSFWRLFRS